MSPASYKSGSERGAWFELVCLRQTIDALEAKGCDASFERSLYRAWLKDADFAKADKENRRSGRYGVLARMDDKQESVSKIPDPISTTPMNYETPGNAEKGISSAEEAISRPSRGRPRKTGEVSRATAWRRRKQEVAQGILL